MNKLIDLLQHQNLVWTGKTTSSTPSVTGSGFSALDEQLGGGFPDNGVVEIASDTGIGEIRLLLPYLQQKQLHQQRLLVFIAAPGQINGQLLSASGFNLRQVLLISPSSPKEALWASEQCLKSGACYAVMLWSNRLEIHQAKRLQLASETGDSIQFVLKRQRLNRISLPVPLSLSCSPHQQGIEVTVNKRKGGWPSQPFTVNMSEQWPALTTVSLPDNLIPFPHANAV